MASKPSKADAATEYDSGIKNFPDTNRNITFDPGTGTMIELAREKTGLGSSIGSPRAGSQYTS